MKYPVPVLSVLCALLISCGGGPAETPDITGIWEGRLTGEGLELELRAVFIMEDGTITGTLDIPQQQARGLELVNISLRGDSVFFDLPSDLGRAGFRGVADGDTLSGSFLQGGFTGSFVLVRTSNVVEAPAMEGEEVVITGEDCSLAGTLTLPEGTQPWACVVLLSGSGLQDRDEYVMGFPVFAELARILDSAGFAVLRCDDRGTGGSTGGMESFSDSVLLYDAGLMLDHVLGDDRMDPGRVGILGHSEGSNTAFRLAAERPEDVAFVVSMAGPSVTGYELIPSQLKVILALQGFSPEEIEAKLQAQYIIMDAALAGDSALIDSVLREQTRMELADLPEEAVESLGDIDSYIDQAVEASAASTLGPWFRAFLTHDPAADIERVSAPVLCLLGELDVQVIPETNLGPMEDALADNPRHSIVVLENANHLFQEALTGGVDEYAVLEPGFVHGFADTLTAWLGSLQAD
ncbi:MAG: alpha/beta hydrolase [Candidatus Fermentibacteraceae bacterium]|nr:alpha/beta hydrolase [Candidatus Fermentibacteraceae bacterium]